jgi:general secretion pathway protein M
MAGDNRGGGLAALALLALALTGMLGAAAAPFLWLGPVNVETAAARELLGGLEARMARQSGAGADAMQPASLILRGETTGIAGAHLQRLINDRVTQAAGHASSFQLLPSQPTGDMTRLSLSLSMSIGIDGLRDVLHGLETGAPLIFIDDLAVRVPASAARQAEPDFIGPFDVTMRVSGFVPADEER